jgi:competence ComEA-like helix-hairpin-helix protein
VVDNKQLALLKQQPERMRTHRLKSVGIGCILLLLFVSCAKQSRRYADQPATTPGSTPTSQQPRVNINTASKNELETLPGIGGGLAERIIDHRTKYGPFRKPEHLLLVDGISAGRMKEIMPLITVE